MNFQGGTRPGEIFQGAFSPVRIFEKKFPREESPGGNFREGGILRGECARLQSFMSNSLATSHAEGLYWITFAQQ